ncbi:YjcQ family protein [Sporosarcina sp.]
MNPHFPDCTPKVTIDGLQYIEDNSGWAKTYTAMKKIRDWIK